MGHSRYRIGMAVEQCTVSVAEKIRGVLMSITETSTVITVSAEAACTLQSIVDAGMAGITKHSAGCFEVTKKLVFTSTSNFSSSNELFIYRPGTLNPWLELSTDSTFQLGLIDGNGDTYDGTTWIIDVDSTASFASGFSSGGSAGDVKLYASTITQTSANATDPAFWRLYRGSAHVVEIKDCVFNGFQGGMRIQGTNSYIENLQVTEEAGALGAISTKSPFGPITDVSVRKSAQAVYWNTDLSGSVTISDLNVRNTTTTVLAGGSSGAVLTLKNPVYDSFVVNWSSPTMPATIDEVYTLEKTFIDNSTSSAVSGVRVYIEDSSSTEITNTTTDGSGLIAQQNLRRGYYNKAGGSTIVLTTPHTFKFRDYDYDFIEFSSTVGGPEDTTTRLVPHAYNHGITEATASALSGIAINGSAKTITITSSLTAAQIYAYCRWWACQSGNAQYDMPMTTADGSAYALASTWRMHLSVAVSGGITLTGDVELEAVINLTAHNITGTLYFDVAGTYVINTSTISTVDTVDGVETVIINTSGGLSIATNNDPTNITINTPQPTVTITGHPVGATVVIHDEDSADLQNKGTSLQRFDNAAASVHYTGTVGNLVSISMYEPGYKIFERQYTIPSNDATFIIEPELETN